METASGRRNEEGQEEAGEEGKKGGTDEGREELNGRGPCRGIVPSRLVDARLKEGG